MGPPTFRAGSGESAHRGVVYVTATRRTELASFPQIDGYELLRIIGEGGDAVVYEARDLSLDRLVAIKVVNIENPRDIERFETEGRAIARLTGQSIVTIYSAARTRSGKPCIVMEMCHGGSYQDRLEEGPLDVGEVVDVGIAVADALTEAHSKRIAHQDIKPANILITREGDAKLSDFGIARFADSGATHGTRRATWEYAPPEWFARSEKASLLEMQVEDVYSLGLTMHSLLAGQVPEIRERFEQGIPPLDRDDVPDKLTDAIRQATAFEPSDRHPNAGSLRAQLRLIKQELNRGRSSGPQTRAAGQPPSPPVTKGGDETAPVELSASDRRSLRKVWGWVAAAAVVALVVGVGVVAGGGSETTTTTQLVVNTEPEAVFTPALAAPGGLRLDPEDGNVVARWQAVVGATRYEVQRVDSGFNDTPPVQTLLLTTTLDPGTADVVCVVVRALGEDGRVSGPTEQVCTQP